MNREGRSGSWASSKLPKGSVFLPFHLSCIPLDLGAVHVPENTVYSLKPQHYLLSGSKQVQLFFSSIVIQHQMKKAVSASLFPPPSWHIRNSSIFFSLSLWSASPLVALLNPPRSHDLVSSKLVRWENGQAGWAVLLCAETFGSWFSSSSSAGVNC